MRFLAIGAALVVLAIALTEYTRRHPRSEEDKAQGTSAADTKGPKKPALPAKVKALLETIEPGADTPGSPEAFTGLFATPDLKPINGFAPITGGAFASRELRGGFGWAVFVVDHDRRSAIVRAAPGEPVKVLAARTARVASLWVDGSSVFFAEGGGVFSLSARGDEPVRVRARFANAVITSLAAVGDSVLVTLMPKDADPLETDAVGAVAKVDSDGSVTLIASEQTRPRDVTTDGKEAFWVSGYPSGLWRAALDGSFASRIAERADGPIAIDGDALVFRNPQSPSPEIRRMGRAGGNATTLASTDAEWLVVSTGLVRYTTPGVGQRLYEVTAGAQPTELLALPGGAKGLALGGTTLFVLISGDGSTTLLAK